MAVWLPFGSSLTFKGFIRGYEHAGWKSLHDSASEFKGFRLAGLDSRVQGLQFQRFRGRVSGWREPGDVGRCRVRMGNAGGEFPNPPSLKLSSLHPKP